jgi:hypothetical protein
MLIVKKWLATSVFRLSLILVYSCSAWSLKSPIVFQQSVANEISFYKTPLSPFASGRASIDRLNQYLQSESKTVPSEIKYSIGLKTYPQSHLNPTTAASLSSVVSGKKNDDELRDVGKFLVIVDTPLYSKPTTKSAQLAIISAGAKLNLSPHMAERFKSGFIKIRHQGMDGYVNISHTMSKFDFAVWIYPKKSSSPTGWLQVKNRLFDEIETTDGHFIHMSQIEGLWTDENKALISSISDPFPLWTQVRILRSAPTLWKSSRLPGHQIVWWKWADARVQKNSEVEQITIDELIKKDIFSVSFHPKNPRKALVSAGGVYHTVDGINWVKLKQFDQFSGPVHYFNDLMMFVGPYRSVDGGKNFENFIRFSELTHSIAKAVGYTPTRLELRSIKTTSALKIILDIDIGAKKIKVQSPIYAQDWSVIKTRY